MFFFSPENQLAAWIGVLTHKNYVLWSCVNGMSATEKRYRLMSVRLGEWNQSIDDDEICAPTPQNIPVAEIIPHEIFDFPAKRYQITTLGATGHIQRLCSTNLFAIRHFSGK